ncbi:helix-turn-helix domain-containing protein [Bacillus sp. 1P06AnD]|uniref:helix-turn-helix domain-containing protein n=1 Tax=Bacillus sp. 1P06AnD TaxID=3132208 RepID=UPI0039A24093
MESLGVKLKKLRQQNGLSQEGLCNELNSLYGTSINKGMVSKWENDREEPRLDYARKLVEFFGTSLDYLLGIDDGVKTIAAHHDGECFTEDELQEIENFKKYVLSKRNKK